MKTFAFDYSKILLEAIGADFKDNHDVDRFGPAPPEWKRWRQKLKRLLGGGGRHAKKTVASGLDFAEPHLAHLEWLYSNLADEQSREILVKIAAFRALGPRKVKLPLNNPSHWTLLDRARQLPQSQESIDTGCNNGKLRSIRLHDVGYPIELFLGPSGVVTQFIEQQYRCETSDGAIECAEGDVVIDAGGCYGDTALYFAYKAGGGGTVASFEFLPENLAVYRRNLDLNPGLASRVRLYERPVWSESDKELFVVGSGPATQVKPVSTDPDAIRVQTLRIDDLVSKGDVPRIDFIKMDIEGAELEALKGAEAVIRRFKPKLAITVYHNFKDFWTIPQFLDSLQLGYCFYLRHFKIHAEETVLFARTP